MKILMAHCHYRSAAPSGEDAVYRNERKLLERHGHEVIPFERFNDDIDDSNLKGKITVARETSWSQPSYDALDALIRKTRPDVAHFHNTFPQMSPSVYAACQDNGVPVVQTLHNYRLVCANGLLLREGKPCEDCLSGSLLPALKHRCYRGSLPATVALVWMLASNRRRDVYNELVNRYIVLSRFAIPRLRQGGLPEARLVVKPNFLPAAPAFNDQREAYAIYVGRLTAEKGVSTLIKAWKNIDGLPLKVLGDGQLRAELEKEVRDNQLNVEFLGFRPSSEVFGLVSKASMQILPSECYEGFSIALLEAFATGTPVVVSRLGSFDELVAEGETGIKFEAGNAIDLANKINAIKADSVSLRQMGARGRALFEREYSAEKNYELLMDIYRAAINDQKLTQTQGKAA